MSSAQVTSQSEATERLGGGVNAVVSGRQPSTTALVMALDVQIAHLSEAGAHGNASPHWWKVSMTLCIVGTGN